MGSQGGSVRCLWPDEGESARMWVTLNMFVHTRNSLSSSEWELFHGKYMLWPKTLLTRNFAETRNAGVKKTLAFLLLAHPLVTWAPRGWHHRELRGCPWDWLCAQREGTEEGHSRLVRGSFITQENFFILHKRIYVWGFSWAPQDEISTPIQQGLKRW